MSTWLVRRGSERTILVVETGLKRFTGPSTHELSVQGEPQ